VVSLRHIRNIDHLRPRYSKSKKKLITNGKSKQLADLKLIRHMKKTAHKFAQKLGPNTQR